jgi:hypothetical protein
MALPGGGTTRCVNCGQPISRYAATCPRWGAPQPHKRMGSTIGLALMLVVLAGALVWAWLG